MAQQAPAAAERQREPDAYDRSQVGPQKDGRIVVPTNQVLSPLGQQIAFAGRPTDVALSPDGKWLAVLANDALLIVDAANAKTVEREAFKNGSYKGLQFAADGRRLYASNIRGKIAIFDVAADGTLAAQPPLPLTPNRQSGGKNALPIGMRLDPSGKSLWVVLNLNNTLAEIDLAAGRVLREIAVGNAPYDVEIVGRTAYVSNWAGRHPDAKSTSGPSGVGRPVRVDPRRFIASEGSVSIVDLETGRHAKQLIVGLHPSGVAGTPDGKFVLVANANSDTVSVIDTAQREVVETISTRPAEKMLFGSGPNALAVAPDGKTVYVANGTNNAVGVIELAPPKSKFLGCFPTGWYPASLALDRAGNTLFVANTKGFGSRDDAERGKRVVKGEKVFGLNSHDYLGSVSRIEVPQRAELAKLTATVLSNNRQTEMISALAPPRKGVAHLPVPARHGEPSVFEHVIYIIKENRTYDQVFGDIEKGEGDPRLCLFGEEVTPNQHKLAEEFVLLDNFYCSGAISADGHQWTNEAYANDYIEKAFGDWPRSYPYPGNDALAYSPTGFIWDNVLVNKKTVRVYGEFVRASVRWKDPGKTGRPSFMECYRDFIDGTHLIDIKATANIESLAPHLCPTAIGFPSIVPDIHRAQQFIDELKRFEKEGGFPNFSIMLLPNDHTAGTREHMPTPAAAVADNDLALGRIVEAVSRSKFWPKTCIFVVEDDPQNGFDHVDGHRTIAQVISPYTRRGSVDSTNYNQTSMVRTVELVLGLPPMNQLDASATPMTNCFTTKIDLTPYTAVPNRIPLDRLNPDMADIRDPRQRHWAEVSAKLDLDDIDRADEDTFNRVLWNAVRGTDEGYPDWAILPVAEREEEDDDD